MFWFIWGDPISCSVDIFIFIPFVPFMHVDITQVMKLSLLLGEFEWVKFGVHCSFWISFIAGLLDLLHVEGGVGKGHGQADCPESNFYMEDTLKNPFPWLSHTTEFNANVQTNLRVFFRLLTLLDCPHLCPSLHEKLGINCIIQACGLFMVFDRASYMLHCALWNYNLFRL